VNDWETLRPFLPTLRINCKKAQQIATKKPLHAPARIDAAEEPGQSCFLSAEPAAPPDL
jgi:hypothetical protein